jgi:hypothetical protein
MKSLSRLWRVIEHDIPWAVSAFVFAQVIGPLRASLKQVTLRWTFQVLVFLVVVWASAQIFPPDLAVMFAGDTSVYIEIATFTYLAIARGQLHRAVRPALQMLRAGLRRTVTRVTARARRTLRRPRLFDRDDDVPDGAFAFA